MLLLVLAGALIAVFFRGLSDLICRKTHWKNGICVAISVIGTLLLLAALFWLMGTKIQSQVTQLSETLPTTIENAKAQISKNPIGQKIIEKATSPESMKKARGVAKTFFKSTFGVLGDMYVVLFIGIYFTVSPNVYKKGLVKLVPEKGRSKANDVLDNLGVT